jgi:hypothetical protein
MDNLAGSLTRHKRVILVSAPNGSFLLVSPSRYYSLPFRVSLVREGERVSISKSLLESEHVELHSQACCGIPLVINNGCSSGANRN